MLSMTECRELCVNDRSWEILSSRVFPPAVSSMLIVSRGADCAWFNARSALILFNGVWGDDSLVRPSEAADLTLEVGKASAASGDGAAGSSVSVIVFESMLSFFLLDDYDVGS